MPEEARDRVVAALARQLSGRERAPPHCLPAPVESDVPFYVRVLRVRKGRREPKGRRRLSSGGAIERYVKNPPNPCGSSLRLNSPSSKSGVSGNDNSRVARREGKANICTSGTGVYVQSKLGEASSASSCFVSDSYLGESVQSDVEDRSFQRLARSVAWKSTRSIVPKKASSTRLDPSQNPRPDILHKSGHARPSRRSLPRRTRIFQNPFRRIVNDWTQATPPRLRSRCAASDESVRREYSIEKGIAVFFLSFFILT